MTDTEDAEGLALVALCRVQGIAIEPYEHFERTYWAFSTSRGYSFGHDTEEDAARAALDLGILDLQQETKVTE